MKTVSEVIERLGKSPRLMQRGADFLTYNLMDILVDKIIPYWTGSTSTVRILKKRCWKTRGKRP
jgi:hypothetical protein